MRRAPRGHQSECPAGKDREVRQREATEKAGLEEAEKREKKEQKDQREAKRKVRL